VGDALVRDLGIRPARVTAIPNGVPRHEPGHAALRRELRLAPGDRLLLAVGNLYPVKGHLHLLEALALLAPRYPTVHLAIAGRGQLEPTLRSRAMALGIGERLHLLGLRSDVTDLLASADLYVLPSLSEGLPLSLLEAMFAGCPIVATAVGDVPHALAAGEAGALVEPGDPPALAAAISRLLDDPTGARLLGQRAAQRAAAEYDVTQMVRRYAGLYERLVHGARRGRVPLSGAAT
jgi:glycosyltransferase involved in cell wall biosynthesis